MTSSKFNFNDNPLGAMGGIKFGDGFANRDTAPDPLAGITPTGNIEDDSKTELDAVAKGFRERRAKEDERRLNATDSQYYFVVCFRNNPDRDEFLARYNMGLNDGDWWVNGYELARMIGFDVGEVD